MPGNDLDAAGADEVKDSCSCLGPDECSTLGVTELDGHRERAAVDGIGDVVACATAEQNADVADADGDFPSARYPCRRMVPPYTHSRL